MIRSRKIALPRDVPTYLEQLCRKAGLPKDAWKDKYARLSIFTADIIK